MDFLLQQISLKCMYQKGRRCSFAFNLISIFWNQLLVCCENAHILKIIFIFTDSFSTIVIEKEVIAEVIFAYYWRWAFLLLFSRLSKPLVFIFAFKRPRVNVKKAFTKKTILDQVHKVQRGVCVLLLHLPICFCYLYQSFVAFSRLTIYTGFRAHKIPLQSLPLSLDLFPLLLPFTTFISLYPSMESNTHI